MSNELDLPKPTQIHTGNPVTMPDGEWDGVVNDGLKFTRMTEGGPEKAALAVSLMERGVVDPLIDKSGQWRKGTFLFDSTGKVTPEWKDAFSAATRKITDAPEHANLSALKLKPLIVSEMKKDRAFDKAYLKQQNMPPIAAQR